MWRLWSPRQLMVMAAILMAANVLGLLVVISVGLLR
jgi:hypothetical protein